MTPARSSDLHGDLRRPNSPHMHVIPVYWRRSMIQRCWATFPPPTSAVPPSRPCSVSSSLWEARVRQLQAVNTGCAKTSTPSGGEFDPEQ
uniref:Uncharacterized protein n=1 Tax=Triticum urartu TaxID=4572 RepID=A0A8R7TJ35_TRIUA